MIPGLPGLLEGTFLVLGSPDLLPLMQMAMSDLFLQEFLKLELRHKFALRQGSPPHRGAPRYLDELALLAPGLHACSESSG